MSIFVRYRDFPCTVKGFTTIDENSDYTIYINARLSYEMQQKTLDHEKQHIARGHLYDPRSAQENETEIKF